MLSMRSSVAVVGGFLGLAAMPAYALEVGETAPCVVLEQKLPGGGSFEGCIRDREANQTHTILEFFSINCGACAQNLPNIVELGNTLGREATTRFVSIDRNRDAVLQHITGTPAIQGFPVALDFERDAKEAYNVRATPTLFILDSNNTVVYKHVGVLSNSDKVTIKNIVTQGK